MIMGRRDKESLIKWGKISLKRKAEFSNHKSCSIVLSNHIPSKYKHTTKSTDIKSCHKQL